LIALISITLCKINVEVNNGNSTDVIIHPNPLVGCILGHKYQFKMAVYHYFLDGRFGVVVEILAYYARGRGFDSRTVQTFVCTNMFVGLGVSMYNMYVFTKKKV
jgi:hypothetical protein